MQKKFGRPKNFIGLSLEKNITNYTRIVAHPPPLPPLNEIFILYVEAKNACMYIGTYYIPLLPSLSHNYDNESINYIYIQNPCC